jgi:hypothetical protein
MKKLILFLILILGGFLGANININTNIIFLKFLKIGDPLQTSANGGGPLQTAKRHSFPFATV